MGAGLGIGQGVMVALQVIAAGGRDGLELVVGQRVTEVAPGDSKRIEEPVVGIIHLIDAKRSPEAAFVEAGVVRHQRQALDYRINFLPHIRKNRGVVGVPGAEAMYTPAEPAVVLRFRMHQAVESVRHFPISNDHDTHAADAAGLLVGSFEVDGGEIIHNDQS